MGLGEWGGRTLSEPTAIASRAIDDFSLKITIASVANKSDRC
ncbi:MAG: hypothetical protein AB4290_26615 [Spirulina sp.]